MIISGIQVKKILNYQSRDINAGVADWLSQLGNVKELYPGPVIAEQYYLVESGNESKSSGALKYQDMG